MEYQKINYDLFKQRNLNKSLFILPVGSLEVHGTKMPFGTDTYIVLAFSKQVAERTDGIIMPPISYTFSGKTKRLLGTINVDIESVTRYIYSTLRSLNQNGFKKVILISIHKENEIAIMRAVTDIYEETGAVYIYIDPYHVLDQDQEKEIFGVVDNNLKEDSILLGSLELLGMGDLVKQSEYDHDSYSTKNSYLTKLLRIGYLKYGYDNVKEHIPARKNANTTMGIEFIKKATEKIIDGLKYYSKYLKDIGIEE